MKRIKKTVLLSMGLLLLLGVAGATLLNSFGMLTTTVDVERAVMLMGDNCVDNICTESMTLHGGEWGQTAEYILQSSTSVNAPIQIVNNVTPNDGGIENIDVYINGVLSSNGLVTLLPYGNANVSVNITAALGAYNQYSVETNVMIQ